MNKQKLVIIGNIVLSKSLLKKQILKNLRSPLFVKSRALLMIVYIYPHISLIILLMNCL